MDKIKFGTDGWRAVISEDFTFENVEIVAQAIADYIKNQKSPPKADPPRAEKIKNKKYEFYGRKFTVVVGYDTRFLSERYAELISCVFAANGIKVILADRPTPTPSVSFKIKHKKLIGGVMVTASHNPAQYNGIKYKGCFGGSAGKKATDFMESRLYKSKVKFMDKEVATKKGLIKFENIIPLHLKYAKKYADMALLKKAKLKVLVDSMNGAGAKYLEEVLKGTGNKVTTINGTRDPYFGGRAPEPNERLLKETAAAVKKGRFDIGLVTDGDADRLGIILATGKVLSGHKVMTLLLLYLFEDRGLKGGVVQTICGTALIDKICKRYRLKTYETSVGFKYIAEIIKKEDILVGGEETGGVAVKNWLPERDAIVSGLLILEMIASRKKPLAKIVEDINKMYGTYVYKRHDLPLSSGKKKRLVAKLGTRPFKKILGMHVVNVKSFDGFKFMRSNGSWLMLRPSGTEPKLRIYSEGRNEKEALKLIDFGEKFALKI
ncbi:MAG: phosphoglucomutase/phosphomannomutase family protein [Candidatus Omnitrophica bacterium]|nr:phosphoglucomutase/phosphomannomutase family protein [Candidatus Omnitrophota bacterium]